MEFYRIIDFHFGSQLAKEQPAAGYALCTAHAAIPTASITSQIQLAKNNYSKLNVN